MQSRILKELIFKNNIQRWNNNLNIKAKKKEVLKTHKNLKQQVCNIIELPLMKKMWLKMVMQDDCAVSGREAVFRGDLKQIV